MENDLAFADTAEAIQEILEDRALFISYGDDDDVVYFVPHEAVLALAWLLSSVAVPILVNLASDEIRDRIDQRLARLEQAPELEEGAVVTMRREVTEIIVRQPAAPISPDRRRAATKAVFETLARRGWPSELAADDAEEIVAQVERFLRQGR